MSAGNLLPPLRLDVSVERWPIAGAFTIARGSRTEAVVVVATVSDGVHSGRGECVPYARYGETAESVMAAIKAQISRLASGGPLAAASSGLAAGAARNALDCALWDWRAKANGQRAWQLADIPAPEPVMTCFTLSLGSPETMEQAARAAAHRPLLKVKLGTEDDAARIAAVRRGAPEARLVVDANEGWTSASLEANIAACHEAGVELIEQPLPAADDAALEGFGSAVLICADESVHDRHSLPQVARRYGAVNIKLDKTGGLTEALDMRKAADALGLKVMVGCMLGTSLGMAPALLIVAGAAYVDLDGPLLLARDREPALAYEGSLIQPNGPDLWG